MMKKLIMFTLLLTVLTGCGARLVSANRDSVVVANVGASTKADAYRLAEKECSKFSKQAFHISNDESAGTATYKCVE